MVNKKNFCQNIFEVAYGEQFKISEGKADFKFITPKLKTPQPYSHLLHNAQSVLTAG